MQEYGNGGSALRNESDALQRKTRKVVQLAQKLFNLTVLEERLLARKKILEAKEGMMRMRMSSEATSQ
jgi:hypothetical protein